jgi:hypothetical protein
MRRSSQAGRANGADDGASHHAIAFPNREAGKLSVDRLPRATVLDDHPVSVFAFSFRRDHPATARCNQRRAEWCSPVYAGVHPWDAEDRMHADAEACGEAHIFAANRLSVLQGRLSPHEHVTS